jgi:hypothetical protein
MARSSPARRWTAFPLVLQWDEDVGTDTGSRSTTRISRCRKFAGKLNKLTLKIDRPKMTAEEVKKLQTAE